MFGLQFEEVALVRSIASFRGDSELYEVVKACKGLLKLFDIREDGTGDQIQWLKDIKYEDHNLRVCVVSHEAKKILRTVTEDVGVFVYDLDKKCIFAFSRFVEDVYFWRYNCTNCEAV